MKLKKEFFIVIFIIVFVVCLEFLTNYISNKYVENIYEKINSIIDEMEIANNLREDEKLEENEKNELNEKIKELKNDWFDKQSKLAFFAEHDELEKVSKCLVVLEENIRNEEFANALEDGKEFIYWVNHFKEKDSLNLKNIF